MTVDLTKLGFDSRLNYMKRSSISGSVTLTLAGAGSSVTTSIAHNLGYIPYFDVFVDFENDGVIWNTDKVHKFTDAASGGGSTMPVLRTWITTTTLEIDLINSTSPTATGTRTVYYVIYLDYGAS
jgi:hypothetical protein